MGFLLGFFSCEERNLSQYEGTQSTTSETKGTSPEPSPQTTDTKAMNQTLQDTIPSVQETESASTKPGDTLSMYTVEELQEKAEDTYEDNDYSDAFRYYQELHRRNAADIQVLARLGYIQHRVEDLKNPEAALDAYNEAIRMIESSTDIKVKEYDWVYNLRGMIYQSYEQDFAKAFADYNKALELNPFNYEALNNRGAVRMVHFAEFKKAADDFNAALNVKNNYDKALCNLGILYSRYLNEYDKALEYLNRTLELNPQFGEAYYFRGVIRRQQEQNCTLAIQDLTRAKEYLPESYHDAIDEEMEKCE